MNSTSPPTALPDSFDTPHSNAILEPASGSGQSRPYVRHLHAKLLAIITDSPTTSPDSVRQALRTIVAQETGAAAVVNLKELPDGSWNYDPSSVTGRLPADGTFNSHFKTICQAACDRAATQIHQSDVASSIFLICTPIIVPCHVPESLAVVVPAQAGFVQAAVFVTELVASYLKLWLRAQTGDQVEWQLSALSALCDLTSRIERSDSLHVALSLLANHLQPFLQARWVAVGLLKNGNMQLPALSNAPVVASTSNVGLAARHALAETSLRDGLSQWPPQNQSARHQLLTLQQFAETTACEAVASVPLKLNDETSIGALLIAGHSQNVHHLRTIRFLTASAPHFASALALQQRAQRSRLSRLATVIVDSLRNRSGWIALGVVLLTIGAMFIPVSYKVRCSCTCEPTLRRFAVAPVDGLITQGFVEPGDQVETGQTLAEMDGREIRWQLAGIVADKYRALRKQSLELTSRSIPNALLAELEATRLQAQEDLLAHRESNLQITSPLNGIVLSGSLERAENASVKTGDVLYEIGSLSPLRMELAIPSDDVSHVRPGHQVKIWTEGLSGSPIEATIDLVRPRSETVNGQNVFIAEVQLNNDDGRLRPGMSGTARITCDSQPLGWTLFHKPWNFLRATFAF